MIETLLEWDKNLFLYLNNLGNSSFDLFWMTLTNKKVNVFVYLTATLFFFLKTKNYKTLLFLLLGIGILILITDQTTNFFKAGFERLRPCHNTSIINKMRLVKSSCGGQYSFFSGHASNSFALASFFFLLLSPYLKKIGFLFFILSSFIAYSRVYIGVHFPLDIFCGALFGGFWGWGFFKIWKYFVKKLSLNL